MDTGTLPLGDVSLAGKTAPCDPLTHRVAGSAANPGLFANYRHHRDKLSAQVCTGQQGLGFTELGLWKVKSTEDRTEAESQTDLMGRALGRAGEEPYPAS